MKTSLTLGLVMALATPMALRADDAAPAAAAPAAKMEAKADSSGSTTEAKAAATPVAKNDAPGSITPGNQLNDDGKYAEAEAYFNGIGEQVEANGHKKREPWRLVGLAAAQIGQKKYDEAAATAQKAIDIAPTNGVAWNDLGSALAQAGKREEAIAAYQKGIEALKAEKLDTTKLEANLAPIKAALDDAKAKADKKAGKVAPAAMSGTAKATDAAPAATSPAAAAADAK